MTLHDRLIFGTPGLFGSTLRPPRAIGERRKAELSEQRRRAVRQAGGEIAKSR